MVRGPAALNGFCDALQLSGHNFLAELLRDEGGLLVFDARESERVPE